MLRFLNEFVIAELAYKGLGFGLFFLVSLLNALLKSFMSSRKSKINLKESLTFLLAELDSFN